MITWNARLPLMAGSHREGSSGPSRPIIGRSPDAAKMLASRARRRVQASTTVPDTDLRRQREVPDAFLAAARSGDFTALLGVLDPDVVLRVDSGPLPVDFEEIQGARNVAERAMAYSTFAPYTQPALINGVPGLVTAPDGQPLTVMAFTIRDGRIVEIDLLADRSRVRQLDLAPLGEFNARWTY